jgi:hypothetical protein
MLVSSMIVTGSIEAVSFSIVPPSEALYPPNQYEQLCFAAKFVSKWGCGDTSDITCAPSATDGHGTATVDGSPLVAKLAQAARMLAVSAMTPLPHSVMRTSLILSAYLRTRGSPWSTVRPRSQ